MSNRKIAIFVIAEAALLLASAIVGGLAGVAQYLIAGGFK